MKKEYIILDLDNTIYPVHSIGEDLFKTLFALIETSSELEGAFELIRRDIMRKPFQVVAKEYGFSDELTASGIELLKDLYSGKYDALRAIVIRDLYELMEKKIDRCRDAGHVVMHIVLKNS